MVVQLKVRNLLLRSFFFSLVNYPIESELEQVQESPPNLSQFEHQIDLFQSIYNEIDNWNQTIVFNNWLRVDARPIKRQLLTLVTQWIDLFVLLSLSPR